VTPRLARHRKIAAALEAADADLLASARPLGTGIGGSTWLLHVGGEPVFVKRVALTDVERRHERSTADLYGLPQWSHYGVGSAGGGAWRELELHRMTSEWVHRGQCENFLLLHHWRVLPARSRTPLPRAELERDVAFRNIVTDGERLYLTDFGLAVASRFDLSDAEAEFLAGHAHHDRSYVLTQLVNWVVSRNRKWPHPRVRNDFIRACAAGRAAPGLPPLVHRYAPLATVVNDFYFALHGESRKTPYPREEIAEQLIRAGLPG
jgi:hypothetical protein